MTDENQNEITKQENKAVVSANPLLDEVRTERTKLEKARDEAKAQADRLEQLKSDQLLSGTAGVHIKTQFTEEEKRQAAVKQLSDEIVGAFRKV